MKVWITCFIVLFGTAELLQWIQQFSLPLPVFILGGTFLAIASNYDKLTNLPFHPDYELPPSKQPPVVAAGSAMPMSQQSGSQQSGSQAIVQTVVQTSARSREAVSFTISKPHQPGD